MPGHGTIKRTPSGAYRVDVMVGRRRLRPTFATRAAAVRYLGVQSVKRAELAAGGKLPVETTGVTYLEMGTELLGWYRAGVRRTYTERTLESYRIEVTALVEHWGKRRLADTTPEMIDAWVAAMRVEQLSISTIRHRLDRLSAMHKLAVRRKLLAAEPCKVERPKMIDKSRRRPIPRGELQKLLEAAGKDFDKRTAVVVLLALDAGLRRAEIANVRCEDVSLEHRYVRCAIRGDAKDRTKSGKQREIPILTTRLAEALASVWREGSERLLGLASVTGIDGIASRAWRPAVGRDPELHRLRHNFATRAFYAGFPPAQIKDWMGHQSIQTTMRYLHSDFREVREDIRLKFEQGTDVATGVATDVAEIESRPPHAHHLDEENEAAS